jgi:predicted peptidase
VSTGTTSQSLAESQIKTNCSNWFKNNLMTMTQLFFKSVSLFFLVLVSNIVAWNTVGNRRDLTRSAATTTASLLGLSGVTNVPLATDAASTSTLAVDQGPDGLVKVTGPQTYSALVYAPPKRDETLVPLILVLHGAGRNDLDVWQDLANPKGEHAGLIPSLIASGRAPKELAEHFAVVAPYSYQKRSFYEEPRTKLLQFVNWVCSEAGRAAGCPANVDPNRIFLFGFSDGATVGVELLTTRRFAGGVICSYGFTGELPDLALQRLTNVPLWVFHSADDVIFPVECSDRLVRRLRQANNKNGSDGSSLVRYSRFDQDPEGGVMGSAVLGHTMGITASKMPELYQWMLSIPAK